MFQHIAFSTPTHPSFYLIRYSRTYPSDEYNMDDVDYGSLANEKSDPAILENLLSNPSANADILSGSNDKYDWVQNGREVEVYIHLEPDVGRKEVKCIIQKDSLSVEVRGTDCGAYDVYSFKVSVLMRSTFHGPRALC